MELDKATMKKILFLIAFTVLLLLGLQNIHSILGLFEYILRLFMPFIIGGCFAFIINIPMRFIEDNLLPKVKSTTLQQFHRAVSITLSLIFIFSIVTILSVLIIPEFVNKVGILINSFSGFVETIGEKVNEYASKNKQVHDWLLEYNLNWASIGAKATRYIREFCNTLLSSTFNVASTIINGLMNLMISFMFSLYLLGRKEDILLQGKQVLYGYLPEWFARKIHRFCVVSNHTFRNFITGQCTEAIIQFTLFFIVLTFLNYPYSLLISVFIAFMSLIPILGSYISSYTSAFLIFIVSPWKAVLFLLLFMVIQQIDSSLIYPKVVGRSVGLPPMWVIMAVTVGGRMLGIIGMITFIPLTSILYHYLGEGTKKRLNKKKLDVTTIQIKDFKDD